MVIETARLRLRRLRPSDAPQMVSLDSDPEVMRYVGSPPGLRSPEETAHRVRQWIDADHGPLGWWIIEGRGDGVFHGLGLLLSMPGDGDVEVGYRLARRSWGQGIATEAAAALVDYAFRELGLSRVVAVTYPDNRGSRRVLEKLGFARDGLREYKGARVDHFTLDASAWRCESTNL